MVSFTDSASKTVCVGGGGANGGGGESGGCGGGGAMGGGGESGGCGGEGGIKVEVTPAAANESMYDPAQAMSPGWQLIGT